MRPVAHFLAPVCLALAACGSPAADPADVAIDVTSSTSIAVKETGRQPVGLARTVDLSSDGLTLFVGVNSCQGDPSAEVDQGTDAIRIAVKSYIPPGDDQDGCADEVIVSLDEPLGERRIIDEVTSAELRPIRVMPPALEALPREGELDTFNAPVLAGFPVDEVLVWAEVSGLTNVDIFNSADEISTTSEFDPHRLVVVVEEEIVVDAEFG